MTVTLTVHEFRLGDVDDPEIYAAGPIYDWQQSDSGKWVMENCVEEPIWGRSIDHKSWGYRIGIRAKFSEQNATYFLLKYGCTK
jgi:hypothetical protein